MKTKLAKSKRILIRVARLCVISLCLLGASIRVHAGQQIDPLPEQEAGESHPHFIMPPDGEAIDPQTTETKNKTVQNQAWEPPPPPPDEFDWIQLTSGEWLKGEFKRLYEKKIEFDSKKMKLLEFKWKDVRQVRCARNFSLRFEGPMTVAGILQITENKVIVTVGDEEREFNRDQLIAIAPKGKKEVEYWSGKISVGANFSEGNTEQIQYNAKANIKRRTSRTRLIVDYLGNLSETDSDKTVNNDRIQGMFDIFQTKKYFFRPLFGEYFRDPIKNIKYRLTLGTGMGYRIIDTPKTDWEIAAGPAYMITGFDTVESGENSSETTPGLMVYSYFNTELTDDIDFIFKYNFEILNEASGTYIHHTLITFETELTEWLDFDTSFVWDRVQDPTPNDDGEIPDQDDLYLIFSLGIDF